MTGYFWRTKDVNAFGAFTESIGSGLYHIADPVITPGIKLWSYGNGDDSAWSLLSTARHQRYIEIQGGPIGDQATKVELKPGQKKWHSEFWFPSDVALDIYQLKLPNAKLRSINEVPLFEWSRLEEINVWLNLLKAYSTKSKIPDPPLVQENLWAPSGMENLDAPFQWAIRNSDAAKSSLWNFYYGVWLAGRGSHNSSIMILSKSKCEMAKVVLARLYKLKGDLKNAKASLDAISEPWLQLSAQVVVERDKILRSFGDETIAERQKWLARVDALKDEWIIERKIQLLIDMGKYEDAKVMLLGTPFQKVHQTYTRTGLWMQISQKLNLPATPIPPQLGEDRLATFGAYREYE